MCCLVAIMALLGPRIALIATWLFTDQTTYAFDSWWMGALGWVVLPWTTLFYAWSYAPIGGVTGFGWVLVVAGFAFDIASWVGGARQRATA